MTDTNQTYHKHSYQSTFSFASRLRYTHISRKFTIPHLFHNHSNTEHVHVCHCSLTSQCHHLYVSLILGIFLESSLRKFHGFMEPLELDKFASSARPFTDSMLTFWSLGSSESSASAKLIES